MGLSAGKHGADSLQECAGSKSPAGDTKLLQCDTTNISVIYISGLFNRPVMIITLSTYFLKLLFILELRPCVYPLGHFTRADLNASKLRPLP